MWLYIVREAAQLALNDEQEDREKNQLLTWVMMSSVMKERMIAAYAQHCSVAIRSMVEVI